ncbi:MAG: tRNA uridine-5-carboxymethylaminomethyl(34) synthesis GTPase MnmE [Bacteroidales bacterium]|jgi:tRNA modification GTPase|nr:tRNA uridine-5-carboxymethylaminomethyl(34) synthesis GTPase MnmE [Bacteroidales bacterium]
MKISDTICAISTAPGIGAIAIIRAAGKDCFSLAGKLFQSEINLLQLPAQKAKFTEIYEGSQLLDQVVITKFDASHSYCGEDMLEIACHGSIYIQQKIVELLLNAGCRMAEPGEFTMRAFLNGKMDLPQAEAVADLIESQSETSHRLAINQLKGQFTSKLQQLRAQLLELVTFLELELDFSEEEVEFADHSRFLSLLADMDNEVIFLLDSFKLGNVLRTGIPVAIIGKPNVGKSTLLNCLIEDDRAIVSHIPGTTRDTIEDTFNIDGITFRFIDTAGIRTAKDEIENFGIERTYKAIEKADVIFYLIDITQTAVEDVENELVFLENNIDLSAKKCIVVANKIDLLNKIPYAFGRWNELDIAYISAKRKVNINILQDMLLDYVNKRHIADATLLTNTRHYDVMLKLYDCIKRLKNGFREQRSADLLSIDMREALQNIGLATGEISTEEILGNIFGRFCIGK